MERKGVEMGEGERDVRGVRGLR